MIRSPSHGVAGFSTRAASHDLALISGPCKAGKASLLFQLALDYQQGNEFLDYSPPSTPLPSCIVSCHEDLETLRKAMKRISPELLSIPHISVKGAGRDNEPPTFSQLLEAVDSVVTWAGVRVLWVDGLPMLCPGNPNIARDVSKFLNEVQSRCKDRGITIITTVSDS